MNQLKGSVSIFDFCTTGGCAAKLNPAYLQRILSTLSPPVDSNLLTNFDNNEDAAIYRINDDIALALTVDIIAPPIDDPFVYGQIAACNALSDIYAMGAKPTLCLSIIAFNKVLDEQITIKILAGAQEQIGLGGAMCVGGHTVCNEQLLFGLAVVGFVHPEKFWSNQRAQPRDLLILTKPIGMGVSFSALRQQRIKASELHEAVRWATTLNNTAAEVLASFEVHAVTDITGFGLAGHAVEMALGSRVTCEIDHTMVPLLPHALDLYSQGISTSITKDTATFIQNHVEIAEGIPASWQKILTDPQTNGGLLAAVPAEQAGDLKRILRNNGVEHAEIIGRVIDNTTKHLIIN